jgi:hypothetical protein
MAKKSWLDRFYVNYSTPKYIRCYVAKEPVLDKYTIVFTKASSWGGKAYVGKVYYVGMSENPFHPLGVCQHGEADRSSFANAGKMIKFEDLPIPCQRFVTQEYNYIWGKEYL